MRGVTSGLILQPMTLRVSIILGKGLLCEYYCTVNAMLPPISQDGEYIPLTNPEKQIAFLYLVTTIHR